MYINMVFQFQDRDLLKKKKKNLNRLKPTNGTNLFYNLLLQSNS